MGSSSKVPVITIEYFTFAHEVKPTTFLSFFFRHVCLYGMSGYLYIYLYVSVYIVHTWVCAHSPSTLNVRVHERERSTPPLYIMMRATRGYRKYICLSIRIGFCIYQGCVQWWKYLLVFVHEFHSVRISDLWVYMCILTPQYIYILCEWMDPSVYSFKIQSAWNGEPLGGFTKTGEFGMGANQLLTLIKFG